jgi:hypothetical protein
MSKKVLLRSVVDILLFFCVAALAGIGLLLKYVLLAGPAARAKYGEPVSLSFLGLGRFEWATIHPLFGFTLLLLLVLHTILHWEQIVLIYRRFMGGAIVRKVVATVFIIVWILLLTFPFMIKPEVGAPRPRPDSGPSGLDYREATSQYIASIQYDFLITV